MYISLSFYVAAHSALIVSGVFLYPSEVVERLELVLRAAVMPVVLDGRADDAVGGQVYVIFVQGLGVEQSVSGLEASGAQIFGVDAVQHGVDHCRVLRLHHFLGLVENGFYMRSARAADDEQTGGRKQKYPDITQVFHAAKIADFRRLQQEVLDVVRSDDLEAAAGVGVEKGGGGAVPGTGIPFEFEGGQVSVAFLYVVYL